MSYEISRDAVTALLIGRGHTESSVTYAHAVLDAGRVYSDPAVSVTKRGEDRYVAVDKARL